MYQHSLSHNLSLEATLSRLREAAPVDALAFFGSRSASRVKPVSDYDLLVVVDTLPMPVFQLFSSIDGRMADILLLETALIDSLLRPGQRYSAQSFEGMMLEKMFSLDIRYDAQQRLQRLRDYVLDQAESLFLPSSEDERYGAWFWHNHSLAHIRRMAQSEDSVYQTAVNLMLIQSLGDLCKAYYRLRDLHWTGEKAAIRYLPAQDPEYLATLRACLAETARKRKLALYESLVIETLAPVGPPWPADTTAVYLRGMTHNLENTDAILQFWSGLLAN